MPVFAFEALGTAWNIMIDEPASGLTEAGFDFESLQNEVIKKTAEFERRFSRFQSGSEVTALREAPAGTYPISPEFTQLLAKSDRLRQLTAGAFDPAVGGLLEAAGYNSTYQLQPQPTALAAWKLPTWSVDAQNQTLTIDGGAIFDLGGIGKGYWIDQISQYLITQGYFHHLVDGGGDMVATTKANGSGYKIALEWPGKPDLAIGTLILKNQGFAASDVFRRRWQHWHHLVNPTLKQSVTQIVGCLAVADSAWQADELTSLLALTDPDQYAAKVAQLGGEYLVVLANQKVIVSPGWPGELF